MSDKKKTPMMKQFFDFKAKYPDAIFLFRSGDFYSTYNEDAITCSKVLGITLTKQGDMNMTMFPHHALDIYLPKLVRDGYRIAICDQLEDPTITKRLVQKGIARPASPTPLSAPTRPKRRIECKQLELNFA